MSLAAFIHVGSCSIELQEIPHVGAFIILVPRQFFISTILILVFATLSPSQSQRLAVISGSVLDDSTEAPLENVNVFLAETTLGSNTGLDGRFEIANIPEGAYHVVASCLGYDVYNVRLSLSSATIPLKIRLKAVIIPFQEVVVSATVPERWRKQLERFRKLFLGSSPNAKECKIVNPEVLDFSEEGDIFSATARAPLIIDNEALGYRIMFLLRVFRTEPAVVAFGGVTGRGYTLVHDGSPKYSPLDPYTPERRDQWKKNRRIAFEGSLRHFLTALFRGSWKDDGFLINLMPEPNIHNTPINRTVLTPETIDLILSSKNSNEDRVLHYEGVLEVEYTCRILDRAIDVLRKQETNSPVSWLQLNHESITFNSYGLVKESMPTTMYGYWTWQRFADMLPLDYEPE